MLVGQREQAGEGRAVLELGSLVDLGSVRRDVQRRHPRSGNHTLCAQSKQRRDDSDVWKRRRGHSLDSLALHISCYRGLSLGETPAYTMASPRSVAVAIIFASPSPSPPRDTAAAHDSHPIAPNTDDKDDDEGPTFLLVSSRKKKNRYVFPKGGIEHGERSPEAAERESWEEGAPLFACYYRGPRKLTLVLMRYVPQPDSDLEPQDT